MTRTAPFASHAATLALTACAVFAFAGCASPSSAEGPTAEPTAEVTPAATPSATPSPSPSTVAVDPADVTTWTITTAGMGPIQRGASAEEVIAGLTTFTSEDYCPGRVALSTDGAASLLLVHPDGVDEISGVWANGRADADGVVPASPSTAAGIGLGSTMDELTAAYPDLEPTNQPASSSYGYAVGDDASGYVNFLVENDVVVMIGVHEGAGVPKEFCG